MAPSEADVVGRGGVRRVRLSGISYGAIDTHLFEFKALDRAPLPPAEPGAHIDVHLPGGLVRQYSLITPLCTSSSYVVGVKRETAGRGGSRSLHEEMKVGQSLEVGAPRNHFPLVAPAGDTVLLAGGIGITPIYAMYVELKRLGAPVRLHYWCRTADHALFHEALCDDPGVILHYSQDKARGPWLALAQVLETLPLGAHVYCCGPRRMLEEVKQRLAAWAPGHLHVEHFGALAEGSSPAAEAFDVVLARTGRTLGVSAGRSILDTLIEADIDVSYSCEQGVCGACETKVLEGIPIHRDTVYSAEEHQRRSTMMICCSRSQSRRIVLDL